MLTSLSMWAIYFASYLIDFILILGISIWKHAAEAEAVKACFWKDADYVTWGVLIIFIVGSFLICEWVSRIEMNSRICLSPENNITIELLGYVVTQVLAIAATIFSEWWIPIDICIFLITGIIFIRSEKVYHSLLFVFPLRNRIFRTGNSVIITNYSEEEMKMALEDEVDGIEARELTKNVYYVRKPK